MEEVNKDQILTLYVKLFEVTEEANKDQILTLYVKLAQAIASAEEDIQRALNENFTPHEGIIDLTVEECTETAIEQLKSVHKGLEKLVASSQAAINKITNGGGAKKKRGRPSKKPQTL